jgi:hypothetical protein
MSLFRRSPDDSLLSRDYLQRANFLQRKTLLTLVSINQAVKLPVASREYFGRPMADTFDLQPASDIVRKVLAQDASLAAWVARDSLIALDALLVTMNSSCDLCRARHKSAYADYRIMPSVEVKVLVSGG